MNDLRRPFLSVSVYFFFLTCLSAQPFPPILRNSWSTNAAGTPVRGQDNLSVTNLGSGTNWLFFAVRPETIARLGDVTNIASSFAAGGLTTNANQFLGVPLAIKDEAFLTNLNVQSSLQVSNGHAYLVGPVTNLTQLNLPHLTISRSAIINAQGDLTNSSADANWSLYPTNVWNERQGGSLLLTNLANNPYTAYTNQVFGGTNISVRTQGGTNFIDTIGELNNWASYSTNVWNSRQGGSLVLTNLAGTGAFTNTSGVGAQSITNLKHFEVMALTNVPGLPDPSLRIHQTNGLGYAELTVTNSVIATNKFVLSIASNTVAIGQVLKIHSTSISGGVNTIILTNDTDTAGGGGVSTNANQFGAAGATLTIKDGAYLTNLEVQTSLKISNDFLIATNPLAVYIGGTNTFHTKSNGSTFSRQGYVSGANTLANYGAEAVNGLVFLAANDVAAGDPNFTELILQSTDVSTTPDIFNFIDIFATTNRGYFNISMSGPGAGSPGADFVADSSSSTSQTGGELHLQYTTNGITYGFFVDFDGTRPAPYTLESTRLLSESNPLIEFKNKGTLLLQMGGDGALGKRGSNQLHVQDFATTNIGPFEIRDIVGRPDGRLLLWQTNSRGYAEISVTNAVIATNRFILSIASNTVAIGHVLKVHSTTIANGVNTIILTNDTDNAGASSLTTNANQFGAQVTLTLRDGVTITNANNVGILNITNTAGLDRALRIWQTNGQGYADITVPTNQWLPTNRFILSITNPVADQVLKILSVSFADGIGSITITNAADNAGSGNLTTNANQFGAQTTLTIKQGALLTNVTIYSSNNTSTALLVTNHPGATVNLLEAYTTNRDGFVIRSNGVLELRASVASGTNGVVYFDSVGDLTQCYTYWKVGGQDQAVMRADTAGNMVFSSATAGGNIYFGTDGGDGTVHFQLTGVADLWTLHPSSTVAAWHGGTARRGQLTNVWDIWGRTNLWLTRTALCDGLVITNDIRFLGHNAASNAVWNCTNATTGEGEWRIGSYLFTPSLSNATIKPIVFGGVGTAAGMTNTTGQLFGLEAGANVTLTPNGSNIVVAATAGGGGLTTNANQFGNSVELTIKSGVLLTNTLFYPSNLTAPATIHLPTTAQVTNITEWRGTNGAVGLAISSNGLQFVNLRLDMSNAVAFRTNYVDFKLNSYQAFTNALQTNLVMQLTNTTEGVTTRVDAYGAGRLGNGRTNAWQLLCTVASGVTIYWPAGTTNGNYDVLVNSNQICSFTFMGGLGATNVLASYRVLEGIGAN